ncbi:hypothetical protein CROQUDRAFT_655816 [Cronartium quercuum f. sp. fusiforme G11]|uniref:Methyltransferase n=1 Tax=Cronartium quercuum f. sp. fusiforme G11 TaxID=708437 RepID=A0A9P6NPA1_9BASI|nr:hypothetical protein CROQUDRAFT_655816 [Cronartium quercuum f. sp. fusiforme G11]
MTHRASLNNEGIENKKAIPGLEGVITGHELGNIEDQYFLNRPEYVTDLEFFKQVTNISDPVELESRVLELAKRAYKIYPYPCIWGLKFCHGKVRRHPVYQRVLELGKTLEGPQPIFIDVGAFFGTDLRQLVWSGYNRKDVLGVDVMDEWNKLGRELFVNDQELPILIGDILSTEFLDPNQKPNTIEGPIDLSSVKSLTSLMGRVRAISANSLFHLFDESSQLELARRLVALIDRRSGSVIFGSHVGFDVPGTNDDIRFGERGMFGHSSESWKKMWYEIIPHEKITIDVELEMSDNLFLSTNKCLTWSVVFK